MEDAGVFENAVWQIELLRSAGFPVSGRRILELGSGWHPILPMVYLVAGADQVILTDVEYLLDARPGPLNRLLIPCGSH